MRNFTFLTDGSAEEALRSFRRAFMEKTATWNVKLEVCASLEEARSALDGTSHAYACVPTFRNVLYEAGYVKGASARLAQGADILYRGGSNMIAISQCARSVVDAIEERFIPIYGARVVVLGSGSAAFDLAYECSRAGVDEVVLLDTNKTRVHNNLEAFLETFGKTRMQILDTEQSREGHLSAMKAYEHTSFLYGTPRGAHEKVTNADIIIAMLPQAHALNYDGDIAEWKLRSPQIVCDVWGGGQSALLTQAQNFACDTIASSDVMGTWGREAADLLLEFGNAQL